MTLLGFLMLVKPLPVTVIICPLLDPEVALGVPMISSVLVYRSGNALIPFKLTVIKYRPADRAG
jgi:hypothetical protein